VVRIHLPTIAGGGEGVCVSVVTGTMAGEGDGVGGTGFAGCCVIHPPTITTRTSAKPIRRVIFFIAVIIV
jgi:hypothetical protein